jgi:hypothetical protein
MSINILQTRRILGECITTAHARGSARVELEVRTTTGVQAEYARNQREAIGTPCYET